MATVPIRAEPGEGCSRGIGADSGMPTTIVALGPSEAGAIPANGGGIGTTTDGRSGAVGTETTADGIPKERPGAITCLPLRSSLP